MCGWLSLARAWASRTRRVRASSGVEPPVRLVSVMTTSSLDLAALSSQVTRAGDVMGTPAYMSPEQFRSQSIDARADVFSFCATLWEALMGERPFAGNTMVELAASVLKGVVRPVPRDPHAQRVPGWLRRVCLQGLAVRPSRRFASMTALLAALDRGRARARTRKWLWAAAATAVLGASAAGYQRHLEATRVATCEAAGAEISQVWSDEARTRVRAGLLASGKSYAAVTADKVMPFLDAHAEAWQTHRTRACLLADAATLDPEHEDRAVWCLDERRLDLAGLVAELSRADDKVVQKAVAAAAALPPVSPCTDAHVLATLSAPPAESRVRADAVRTTLSQARSQLLAGKYAEGREHARLALVDAEALGWAPMIAAVRQVEGELLEKSGAYADAELASTAAYMTAAKVQAWDVAASAATSLVTIVGAHQTRFAESKVWAGNAEVAISLAGDPLGLRTAARLNSLANVLELTGAYAEARPLYERALHIHETALGPDDPSVAIILNNVAMVHESLGAYTDAMALYTRALEIFETTLGPEHPHVAVALDNLASVHGLTGDLDEATALHERALAMREKVLGPDHPHVAISLNNVAIDRAASGDHASALPRDQTQGLRPRPPRRRLLPRQPGDHPQGPRRPRLGEGARAASPRHLGEVPRPRPPQPRRRPRQPRRHPRGRRRARRRQAPVRASPRHLGEVAGPRTPQPRESPHQPRQPRPPPGPARRRAPAARARRRHPRRQPRRADRRAESPLQPRPRPRPDPRRPHPGPRRGPQGRRRPQGRQARGERPPRDRGLPRRARSDPLTLRAPRGSMTAAPSMVPPATPAKPRLTVFVIGSASGEAFDTLREALRLGKYVGGWPPTGRHIDTEKHALHLRSDVHRGHAGACALLVVRTATGLDAATRLAVLHARREGLHRFVVLLDPAGDPTRSDELERATRDLLAALELDANAVPFVRVPLQRSRIRLSDETHAGVRQLLAALDDLPAFAEPAPLHAVPPAFAADAALLDEVAPLFTRATRFHSDRWHDFAATLELSGGSYMGSALYREHDELWPDCPRHHQPMRELFQIDARESLHATPPGHGLFVVYVCDHDDHDSGECDAHEVRHYRETRVDPRRVAREANTREDGGASVFSIEGPVWLLPPPALLVDEHAGTAERLQALTGGDPVAAYLRVLASTGVYAVMGRNLGGFHYTGDNVPTPHCRECGALCTLVATLNAGLGSYHSLWACRDHPSASIYRQHQ